MKKISDEIKIIARDEYNAEFEKERQELIKERHELLKESIELNNETIKLKNENVKLKNGIKKLSQIKDLNSPEAKKILNSPIVP